MCVHARVIRCLGDKCVVMVADVSQAILALFHLNRASACLYVASVLVSVFGDTDENIPWIMDMVTQLTAQTFQTLGEVREGGRERERGGTHTHTPSLPFFFLAGECDAES